MSPLRSLAAVLGGVLLISLVSPAVEFGMVWALAGEPTRDPGLYYALRNRTAVLIAKIVWGGVLGFAAGWLAARIAADAPRAHAALVAAVQALTLLWALFFSAERGFTPAWLWIGLIVVTVPAVLAGGAARARQEEA